MVCMAVHRVKGHGRSAVFFFSDGETEAEKEAGRDSYVWPYCQYSIYWAGSLIFIGSVVSQPSWWFLHQTLSRDPLGGPGTIEQSPIKVPRTRIPKVNFWKFWSNDAGS